LESRFHTTNMEEKEGGNTCWALFASEEIGEGIGTWCRATGRSRSSRGTCVASTPGVGRRRWQEPTRTQFGKGRLDLGLRRSRWCELGGDDDNDVRTRGMRGERERHDRTSQV